MHILMFKIVRGCVFLTGNHINNCVKKYTNIDTNEDYHITILSPHEYKSNMNIDLSKFSTEFVDIGIGKIKDDIHYIVCYVPSGKLIRQSVGIETSKDYHITILCKRNDIHNGNKDINTIYKYNENIDYNLIDDSSIMIQLLMNNKDITENDLMIIAKKFIKNMEIIDMICYKLNDNLFSAMIMINKLKTSQNSLKEYLLEIVNNKYKDSLNKNIKNTILNIINENSENYYIYNNDNDIISFIKLNKPRNFSKIDNNLYGSSIPTNEHTDFLNYHKFTDIITLMEQPINLINSNQKFHFFKINDHSPPQIDQMNEIIEIIKNSKKVLVHCLGGVGRTATILIGYLMNKYNISKKDSEKYLINRKTILTHEQELFLKDWYKFNNSPNIKLPKLIILIGLPASGKTILSSAIEKTYSNSIRLNGDEIREKGKLDEIFIDNLKNNKTIILDRCNLTILDREYWLKLGKYPKTWCIYFNSNIDECIERIKNRKNHPTIGDDKNGEKILINIKDKLQPPTLKEGYEKIIQLNDIEESNNLMIEWKLIMESKYKSDDLIKFPRTTHILNLGSATRDDLIMDKEEILYFLNKEILIEEKIDGANLGISIGNDNKIYVQNRGHFINSDDHAQFKYLDKWINNKKNELYQILIPDRYILYGEWLYAKHSIKYTKLPDYFIAFDIFDKLNDCFLSRNLVSEILKKTSIHQIKLINNTIIKNIEDLKQYVYSESQYYEGIVEGIYCRINNKKRLLKRGKIVRSDFLSGEIHWSKFNIEPNIIIKN